MVLGVRGMPNVSGGIETHAEQLYGRLSRMGCRVEILVRSPYVPVGTTHVGAIRLRRLWSPRSVGLEAFVHSLLGVVYAAFSRPDVLHVHAIGPSVVVPIARLFGLKTVMTHHGMDYEREKWGLFARRLLQTGERIGVRWAHACIAISRSIAAKIASLYGVKAHYIPNGVAPVTAESGTDHLQRLGLTPGKYFLHVGRMVPEKRQLDLVRAYARLVQNGTSNWKMVLVGGLYADDYSERVRQAAAESGVILTGYLNGQPLQQLYAHAGAFVLPSTHEGLPIVLLEALSYGLPVMASDIPANTEVGLDHSSYFAVGDIEALRAGLMRLQDHPLDESERAALRHRIARQYDWDEIAVQTRDLYRNVLQLGPSTPLTGLNRQPD
jgi:glycosyltransferase involved in cell wall biosynthesis